MDRAKGYLKGGKHEERKGRINNIINLRLARGAREIKFECLKFSFQHIDTKCRSKKCET